ncbi:MAG: alpha/beta hydrolase [Planctomycetes bacterium]|nr:alpha/beta hydrolase [Planctomycetota bacterium]
MRLRSLRIATIVGLGLFVAFSTVSARNENVDEFWKVWRDRKADNLQKNDAVSKLVGGDELVDPYLEILESDVWQYRAQVIDHLRNETNEALLKGMEDFLFDEKQVAKKPAAGEHVLWALYNNANWVKPEKWDKAKLLVMEKKVPEKVKARMLRELGRWRGTSVDNPEAQALARQNVKILVDLLAFALEEKKKFSPELRFLIGDALESLTSQDFGDDLAKWQFFANNMKETEPLKPRTAQSFKDELADVEIEGHSFASPTPRPVDLEMLILPDLGKSDQYWYPYIFELNKTFKCTFVKLPDCSRMKDIEFRKDRNGNVDRNAYFYPLKQLVEAFEERRMQSKQKKIGLIAHGVSGWIALEYLRLHPESVAFAIIIQTWSGENSREQARNACEGSKDEAFKDFGRGLIYDPTGRIGFQSLNESERMWYFTGAYKRRWADPKALEPIFYNSEAFKVPAQSGAQILVPHYEFDNEMKGERPITVPTLFIHGAQDPMFVSKDEKDYRKGFSNMTWAVYKDSADTPWAEEPVHFFTDFKELLDKNHIIEDLKKEAEEAKKGG